MKEEDENIFHLTHFVKNIKENDLQPPFVRDEKGTIFYSELISTEPKTMIKSILSTLFYPKTESCHKFVSYAKDTNFMNFFPILKSNVPTINLESATHILNSMRQQFESNNEIEDQKNDFVPDYFTSKDLYEDLSTAAQKIDDLDEIQDGDTLVIVGNTPQFIYETHKIIGRKKLNYLKIAISGTPGKYKPGNNWYESILITEKSIENYRRYLKEVGLINNNHKGNVFFMDIISSGMGIKFLKKELINAQDLLSKQKIYILGINPLEEWANSFKGEKEIEKCLSLDLDNLATQLDKIPNRSNHPLRVMPRLPSYMWENMDLHSLINIVPGEKAQKIIDNINVKLYKKDN